MVMGVVSFVLPWRKKHAILQFMVRNVIFDWSGTLVDDLPAVLKATNHVFRQAGIQELSIDRFRAEFCLPFKKFYDRYLPHVPMEQLEEWFHGEFRKCNDMVEPLPHAGEFLKFCRSRGMRTFLLSTVNEKHFDVQVKASGFGGFLDRCYLGVMDKRKVIHDILKDNALLPEETVFIGDMQHDVDTAHHGGIGSCAVLTGYNDLGQLRASRPDRIVEHLGELHDLLVKTDCEWSKGNGLAKEETHPIPTVGALIYNGEGKVLMVRTHKWGNLWGIPGGKIKTGETSLDALKREIMEETNLGLSDIRFELVQDCIHSTEFYRDAHFVLLNYTATCVGIADVRLNEEAREFVWVTLEEAMRMEINTPTRVLLESVVD
jgi:phosphoglycolate phosphatase-like HAD superfamily hydrolase/ADP-ribose pyrophosphatase YjhB (NUDIX family)